MFLKEEIRNGSGLIRVYANFTDVQNYNRFFDDINKSEKAYKKTQQLLKDVLHKTISRMHEFSNRNMDVFILIYTEPKSKTRAELDSRQSSQNKIMLKVNAKILVSYINARFVWALANKDQIVSDIAHEFAHFFDEVSKEDLKEELKHFKLLRREGFATFRQFDFLKIDYCVDFRHIDDPSKEEFYHNVGMYMCIILMLDYMKKAHLKLPVKIKKIMECIEKRKELHIKMPKKYIVEEVQKEILGLDVVNFIKRYKKLCEELGIPREHWIIKI